MADVDVLMPSEGESSVGVSRKQHLMSTFESYRAELDTDNERRERLIILSRSITQLSKKLIFHLHRNATSPSSQQKDKCLREGRAKEREIWVNFGKIKDELKSIGEGDEALKGYWRWNRQVSPGLEEYIEALSFLYYLEHKSLVPLDAVQKTLSDEAGEPLVIVTPEDYILGMSDLTGELMRYATNALSTGDHNTPLEVCEFVRTVKAHFDGIPPHMLYKLSKKQEETTRSLEKIEKVCYALRLRLIEFADKPEVLAMMAKRALEDAAEREEKGRED
ncbi:hypothetical protein I302_101425 [Kwoniella bestiolae CBS 10118]|uniref:Translin n=1 Tax=Kwoniella bestiolae CBS 10118 TaxID=1296100 RepID=A0A1B9GC72_9TREE|nr:hypothetical protein I302_00108 [Kwoniella bestiolae CBS 10118]OCF28620.1 hypothetical protein I302_00108 [Kwoniella bestiolae CBS 10118]